MRYYSTVRLVDPQNMKGRVETYYNSEGVQCVMMDGI